MLHNLSIFSDWSYITWADSSHKPNCIEVIQITDEEHNQIISGTHYFDVNTKELVEKPVPIVEEEEESEEEITE